VRFGLYSSSVGNETVRLTQWLAFARVTALVGRKETVAGKNMPLHRAIKDRGMENFSLEAIKTVEYIDSYHLLKIINVQKKF
jgi:hypothetical protein